ncbi:uncharacterized protein LOC103471450 isoform X1 [Poecilia reticulata]|uniref:uncharacterized protein LOC103471450 isoform X1 n=1 Tax=Poecilia reticulata TaxID=8081 RepID=UPI0004A4D9BC|nr:PREDICTED: uncharacterized protein LOC103471450 isoform X1 [Poecilia reticulata]
MFDRNIFIEHALNVGERKIGPYFADGFCIVSGVPTVLAFHGCFWHSCSQCFIQNEKCPLRNISFEQIRAASDEKDRILQSKYGVQLEVVWEHEWIEIKRSDQRVINFLKKMKFPEPLVPRNALFGGRTSAFKLRHTATPDETVHYVDFTSLYPYVNSRFPYPLGHPKIIYKDFDHPDNYFGFIRAVVFPPRGLYFPVLPYKTARGKLVFTLCRTCAEKNNQMTSCAHSDQERALTGVWVSVEFQKALRSGYRMEKITEVWYFDRSSSSIFKDFIHTFLKGKQEASGYPAEATDQESKEKYVREYKLHQGIQLDPEKIAFNPAKRHLFKNILNGF